MEAASNKPCDETNFKASISTEKSSFWNSVDMTSKDDSSALTKLRETLTKPDSEKLHPLSIDWDSDTAIGGGSEKLSAAEKDASFSQEKKAAGDTNEKQELSKDGPVGSAIENLPASVQGLTKAAIQDLQDQPNRASRNLEAAIKQAAKTGNLGGFCEAFNEQLKAAGLPQMILHDRLGMQAGDHHFDLWNKGTNKLIDQIGPVNERPVGPKIAANKNALPQDAPDGKKDSENSEKRQLVLGAFEQLKDAPSSVSAEKFVEKIAEAAKTGDASARNALLLLIAAGDKGAEWQKQLQPNDVGYETLPDLSKLPKDVREQIKVSAVKGLIDVASNRNGLEGYEATLLGLALVGTVNDSKGDGPLSTSIRVALKTTTGAPVDAKAPADVTSARRVEKVLDGLFQALKNTDDSGSRGVKELTKQYIEAVNSPNNRFVEDKSDRGVRRLGDIGDNFRLHVEHFREQAKTGSKEAIAILAALSDGSGTSNERANPKDNPSDKKPGHRLAKTASDDLVQVAKTSPEMRSAILDALMNSSLNKASSPGSMKLETLGRVAGLDPENISKDVRLALRDGLERPREHKDAAKGMIALGAGLDINDVAHLTKHLTPDVIEQLSKGSFKLNPERGRDLSNQLAKIATNSDGANTPEQSINALKALGHVGVFHATDSSTNALKSLSGVKGREHLTQQIKRHDPTLEKTAVADLVEVIQMEAGKTLLTIAEKSPFNSRRTDAFDAFAEQNWGQQFSRALTNNTDGTQRLLDLMHHNPDNVSMQSGIPKLLYGIDKSTIGDKSRNIEHPSRYADGTGRIAAAFKDMGVSMNEESLLKFTDLAIKNYGREFVEKIPARVALINSLPTDAKKAITAFEGEIKEPLNLAGRTIDARTFNRLPEQLRQQLSGTAGVLVEPTTLRIPTGTNLSPEIWAQFPQELRAKLFDGAGNRPIKGVDVDLSGKTIDAVSFNKLTEAQRALLNGTGKKLFEGEVLTDLSRVGLNADQFNKLDSSLKLALGHPADVAAGSMISLSGQSIDSTTFNRLPNDVRIAITGYSDDLPTGRLLKDLSSMSIDATVFNSLPKESRHALSASSDLLDPSAVLGRLANGTIGDAASTTRCLIGPPPPEVKLENMINSANLKAENDQKQLGDLKNALTDSSNRLKIHSEDGVGFLGKVDDYLTIKGGGDRQNSFINAQGHKVFNLTNIELDIAKKEQQAQFSDSFAKSLEVAQANFLYMGLMSQGRTEQADELALNVMAKFGRPGPGGTPRLVNAPDIEKALMAKGEGTNSSVIDRLFRAGKSQFGDYKLNNAIGTSEGVEQGLKLLASISPSKSTDGRKVMAPTDAALLRKEGFAGIDSEPAVRKLTGLSKEVSDQLVTLGTEIGAVKNNGDRFKDFISDVNRRGDSLEKSLNKMTPEELNRIKEVRNQMEQTLKDGSIRDDTTRDDLTKRINALDTGLLLFDKDFHNDKSQQDKVKRRDSLKEEVKRLQSAQERQSQPPHDGLYQCLLKNHSVNDADSLYWKTKLSSAGQELQMLNGSLDVRQKLDEMLELVRSPEVQRESDFQQWMAKDGVEILAATAAAVAAVAFVAATFGTGAILLGAAGTAGFMLGRELTKEVQRAHGIRNDGSLAGDYSRGQTLTDDYGNRRSMDFWDDVAKPYTLELGMGTACAFAGGKAGAYIGQTLRSLGRSGIKQLSGESGKSLVRLTENITALEGQTAKSPWVNELANAAYREARMQAYGLPASYVAEAGITDTLKTLGVAICDANALTSFLVATAVSAPCGALHPRVLPQTDSAPPRPGEPNLRLQHCASREVVDTYIKSAENNGSVIERKSDGAFVETTKDGLKVEFSRVGSEPKAALSLPEANNARDTSPAPAAKNDPVQTARLKQQLDAMMKPATELRTALDRFDIDFFSDRSGLLKEINNLPATDEGNAKALKLNEKLEQLEQKYANERVELRRQYESTRDSILFTDQYRQAEIAHSMSRGLFPRGEFLVDVPDRGKVLLVVEMGKNDSLSDGMPVPVKHVEELMHALKNAEIIPDKVRIRNMSKDSGYLMRLDGYYEIGINIGTDTAPLRMTYNHETGHLYDFKHFRNNAKPEAIAEISDAYKAALLRPGGPADVIAKHLKENISAAHREKITAELTDPANHDILSDRLKAGGQSEKMKYYACKGEVFAEMYKLYVAKQGMMKQNGGQEPTYAQLLERFTAEPRRDVMKGMESVYKVLEKHAFKEFEVIRKANSK